MAHKTDYKNAVFDKRKWVITDNGDGTYTIEDATTYTQQGDVIGADYFNGMGEAMNAAEAGIAEAIPKSFIISSADDLAALTEAGFLPDAMLVQQLNKNIQNVNVYIGDDGKLHFVDSAGADSALPFSSGLKILELGIFEVALNGSEDKTVSVTFKNVFDEPPKLIFLGDYMAKTESNFQYWGLNPYTPYQVLHEMVNPTTTGFSIRCKNTSSSVVTNRTLYACVAFEDWEKLASDVT